MSASSWLAGAGPELGSDFARAASVRGGLARMASKSNVAALPPMDELAELAELAESAESAEAVPADRAGDDALGVPALFPPDAGPVLLLLLLVLLRDFGSDRMVSWSRRRCCCGGGCCVVVVDDVVVDDVVVEVDNGRVGRFRFFSATPRASCWQYARTTSASMFVCIIRLKGGTQGGWVSRTV